MKKRKRKRTAAQKAATKRMIAANKARKSGKYVRSRNMSRAAAKRLRKGRQPTVMIIVLSKKGGNAEKLNTHYAGSRGSDWSRRETK